MTILEIGADSITTISKASLIEEGVKERGDLQRLLLESVESVAPNVMVIAEEFGSWTDSRRRIDILGLDKDANLVVIELKRTEDGGHMELQALRYAAMASVMTFDQVVETHGQFLSARKDESDARDAILEFLEWEEPNPDDFAQDVRIVLVSVEFSKEITTTVLWLNDKGVDIQCVRLTPYKLEDRLLVDVQQIIPLPEAASYQTQVREKKRSGRAGRGRRDLTRFTLELGGEKLSELPKRHAIYQTFRFLVDQGVSPDEVVKAIAYRKAESVVTRFEGEVSEEDVLQSLDDRVEPGKRGRYHPGRWFTSEDELIRFEGDTYIVSNQWGRYTERALLNMATAFPEHTISIEAVKQNQE